MSMNYVGSISLMDRGGDVSRGDSPAQAILDKNARSVAQRIADETREELEKVLARVDHIYDSYENSMELIFQTQHNSNLEYVNDIAELEEIMKDQIKKRKYQQGITIFIVGYENVCGQRLKLLQNVNEFFMENSKSYEDEDWFPKTPDLDLDDCAEKVDESLTKADELANRLGEINQEMVTWLSNYAINKASNKGKKKLEKSLEKAKEDMGVLSEKLHNLQTDLEKKDEKVQDLLKMLEVKNLENQKYKTAADIAKKNISELEIEHAIVKEDLEKRKDFMKDLQRKLNKAENELSQNNMLQDMQASRFMDENSETETSALESMATKKKMTELQEAVDKNKAKMVEVKREIEKFHEQQIQAIIQAHAVELETMKNQYDEELKKAKVDIDETQKKIEEAEAVAKTAELEADSLRHDLINLQLRAASADTRSSELADLEEDHLSTQQDSRPSTKNSKQSSKGRPLPAKSPRRDGKSSKDLAESTSQDEGGDPNSALTETRQSKRAKSTLEPVKEGDIVEFTDEYDLKDDNAWATLPVDQMHSRYVQYRKLTRAKLAELEEQLDVTVAKTQRKVNNLKSQFQEHKGKWELERKLLIEQVEQAHKLQTEAEKEADTAMSQLEEFINEQERLVCYVKLIRLRFRRGKGEAHKLQTGAEKKADTAMSQLEEFINEQERLEDEEEGRRSDIVKAVAKSPASPQKPDEPVDRKSVSSDTQTQKEPEEAAKPVSQESTEPELSRLMQQTDDAKSQRQRSETLSDMGSDVAPWMRAAQPPAHDAEVFDTPDLKMRSKMSYRSRSELNRPESEKYSSQGPRAPAERNERKKSERIKSERSEQVTSSVSHGNDFDERDEEDLDADVELFTDEVEPTSQRSRRSRNSRNRSSMSRKSLSKAEMQQLESRRGSLKSGAEESGQKSRSSKESSQKSRRSSLKDPAVDTDSQRVISRRESIRSGIIESQMSVEEEEQIAEEINRSRSQRGSVQEVNRSRRTSGTISQRGSIHQDEMAGSRRGSLRLDEMAGSRRGSTHPDENAGFGLRRDSALHEDGLRSGRGSRRPSLLSKASFDSGDEEEIEDDFQRKVQSRGRMKDGGRETAPPYFKQVQEMNSRIITGAMSAPPAVEDGVSVADKPELVQLVDMENTRSRPGGDSRSRSPRPDKVRIGDNSQVLQPSVTSAYAIEEITESNSSKSRSPQSDQGQSARSRSHGNSRSAWYTPREEKHNSAGGLSPRSIGSPTDPLPGKLSRNENFRHSAKVKFVSPQIISTTPIDMLPPTQAEAIDSIKEMIIDEKLSSFQTRTLDSVRMALQQINTNQENLTNNQLERTLTIISLASQLTEESIKLGVFPDSIFDTFAALNSHAMSEMTHGEDDHSIDDMSSHEFLLPITATAMKEETQTSPLPQPEKAQSPESERGSSAKSRASLRSQYKAKLEETRHAVEERRSNTPVISIPSQRSLDEDQLIDEDEDDVALPDDMKSREPTMDVATSPPPRRSISMSRHSHKLEDPLVQEYLKTYDSIISFRDALSKILLDREMLQASQVLTDLETARLDREDKVEPQVEKMTFNAYYLFEEIIAVLGSILYTEEREPAVSSMMVSREGTKPMREKSAESLPPHTRHSRISSVTSPGIDKNLLVELQRNYENLQQQFESESKKHEEQIRHNTVVMMEMQDTINELQRELGNLGRSASRIRQSSDLTTPQGQTESAIMFTRLDSERNAKIMKRAVNDQKLDPDQYKDVVAKMEDYISIPAKRLAHLVRKYVHHCRMKEIEENVKKSKSLDENVFDVLDKMENFQNKRAKKWAEGMDHMGNDRIRFANILMETLEDIEQQSGIFLIKPMYSFKGRDIKERYGGKLARPMRPQRNISPTREISAFAPAPTPASNIRGLTRGHISSSLMQHPEEEVRMIPEPQRPLVGDESGITGAGMTWVGSVPRATWNIGSSQVRTADDLQNPNMMNTPRILELDINRMMIGQNNISTRITSPGVSEDRLVNASQNNLRSYVTVNRPAQAPGQVRPSTFSSVKDNVPPSSPSHQYSPSPSVQKRVRMSDGDVSRALNSTPPLPPISAGSKSRNSPDDRQDSFTGIRPQVLEIVSPLK